jgi:hypothetical protein
MKWLQIKLFNFLQISQEIDIVINKYKSKKINKKQTKLKN